MSGKAPPPGGTEKKPVKSGLGALCAEAQADGVPCMELGKDCEQCERALAARLRQLDSEQHGNA